MRKNRLVTPVPHILVVGGGYVGMYAAYRLQRHLRRGEATVTVVNPQPNMTYQPFLAEAAAGSIEPRHVVVPLRKVLRGCRVITATVTDVDHTSKTATAVDPEGARIEVAYDVLVMALGSIAQTDDLAKRRRRLTFVVVGGGYSGVEIVAELEDMARYALRLHPHLSASDMRWVLIEATDRILPEVSPSLGGYAAKRLRQRGIEVHFDTRVESMVGGDVLLSTLRGTSLKPYQHANAGSVASLGLHNGAAEIYGIRLRGWLAWFIHRTYHVSLMPTANRKARIVADWTLALIFSRDVVSLEQVQHPRLAWQSVARTGVRRLVLTTWR